MRPMNSLEFKNYYETKVIYLLIVDSKMNFRPYTIHKNMSLGPKKSENDSKIGQSKTFEKTKVVSLYD